MNPPSVTIKVAGKDCNNGFMPSALRVFPDVSPKLKQADIIPASRATSNPLVSANSFIASDLSVLDIIFDLNTPA